MDIADLEKFNPWWTTGAVAKGWSRPFRRVKYADMERFLKTRQMLVLHGLRRTGKTTILFQLIEGLLAQVSPRHILYFSFDELVPSLREVLDTYQNQILGKTFRDVTGTLYLFLDEIQKLPDWENAVKVLYDLYPHLKIIISGSASASLRKRSTESLAGRAFDFTLEPLTFIEFLSMKGMDVPAITSRPALWKRELLPLFYTYLKFGTFPELVDEQDEDKARAYIISTVVERVIYKDLPQEFPVSDLELLRTLVHFLGKNPGSMVNYRELAKDLGRDQRTIANYFEYLEYSLLIRFVYNYRGSPLASRRKLKKAYFTTPNIIFAMNTNIERVLPYMLENAVMAQTGARFFYKNRGEVDFVLPDNNTITAIEVKSGQIRPQHFQHFVRQMEKKTTHPLFVAAEAEGDVEGIPIVPAWKFLLQPPGKPIVKGSLRR